MPAVQESLNQIDTEQAYRTLFENSSCVRPAEVIHDARLSAEFESDIYLLSELGQNTGAYKIRGAFNWFENNSGKDIDEVVAFSAGNHAAAVAACARHFGVKATIFMPENTPAFKVGLVRKLGGQSLSLVSSGHTVDDSADAGREYLGESAGNPAFIHPFDDSDVVSGQGTLGLELAEYLPHADIAVVPVGGGGLLSGIIHATRDKLNLDYVGAEPPGAPSLANNLENPGTPLNTINTYVDGAAVKQVGGICLDTLDGIEESFRLVHPSNESLRRAVTGYWEKDGQFKPELAGALSVAALGSIRQEIKGKTVVCVVSGGNLSRERYEREVRLI